MNTRKFKVGDKVIINDGKYAHTTGYVKEDDGRNLWVRTEIGEWLPFMEHELTYVDAGCSVPDNVSLFRKITKKMADTYAKKNVAYGDSFAKSYDKYGKYAAIVRMSDKWNRLENLALNNIDDNGESIKDTLLDLACYSVMYLIELENGKR